MAENLDLQQYYNTPEMTTAKGEAEAAQRQSATYQSASALLPIKLREAVMEKLDYNKDVIAQQNKAMAEYFAAPSRAREKYQGIWNPFTREKLVAEERTQAYAPYATLTDILGQRMGTISDIIGAGTAGFQSATSAAQSAAQAAQQRYSDLFQTAQAMVGAKQFEASHALDWYKALHPSGGGGMDLSGLLALLGQGQKEGISPTEPKPIAKPTRRDVQWHSPKGQWVWDTETQDWYPVVD